MTSMIHNFIDKWYLCIANKDNQKWSCEEFTDLQKARLSAQISFVKKDKIIFYSMSKYSPSIFRDLLLEREITRKYGIKYPYVRIMARRPAPIIIDK